MKRLHKFEKEVLFSSPLEEVFAFHTCMDTVCWMLPDHLTVECIQAPCHLKLGDTIQYKVCLHSFYFCWQTTVVEYEENVSFTDLLEEGPFSFWRHQHLFEEEEGGTLMTDRIEYKLKFGVFGGIAAHFFVRRELDRIFTNRHEKALQHLE